MLATVRVLKRRIDSLFSWTSDLGDPQYEVPGLVPDAIRYAEFSAEIDQHLARVKADAQANSHSFRNAPHALQYFDNHWARMNVTLGQLSDLPRGAVGADIGVAYGYVPLVLRDAFGVNTTGAELQQFIDVYCPYVMAHGIPVIPWDVTSDSEPFHAGSLDFVVYAEILEHIKYPPRPILEKLSRILRNGGRLVLSTPNFGRFDNIWRLTRGYNLTEAYPDGIPIGADATDYIEHVREYTISEVVTLIQDAGLTVSRVLMFNPERKRRYSHPYLEDVMCLVTHKPA
jgi:SAM-dependent methyltransferase